MRARALCLAGPTASGKTAAALAFARALAPSQVVEVISVDSALVYRGMDIGTAKPSATERAEVPHHLIDILDPAQAYSAAQFAADARRLIEEIVQRGHLPLLVGGTMLYFKALREGLHEIPGADAGIRQQIDAEAATHGWPALHAELARVDPATAARLAPADAQRIQRALEVWRLTGKPLSAWHQGATRHAPPAGAPPLVALEPDSRDWLHERIAARFDVMLAAGLLDEVKSLRARRPACGAAVDALRRLPTGLAGAGHGAPGRAARNRHRGHAAAGQAPAHLAALDAGAARRGLRRPRGRPGGRAGLAAGVARQLTAPPRGQPACSVAVAPTGLAAHRWFRHGGIPPCLG